MADFIISTKGGDTTHTGDSRYSIDDTTGILTVYADDGMRFQYAPSFWQSIEDRPRAEGGASIMG